MTERVCPLIPSASALIVELSERGMETTKLPSLSVLTDRTSGARRERLGRAVTRTVTPPRAGTMRPPARTRPAPVSRLGALRTTAVVRRGAPSTGVAPGSAPGPTPPGPPGRQAPTT